MGRRGVVALAAVAGVVAGAAMAFTATDLLGDGTEPDAAPSATTDAGLVSVPEPPPPPAASAGGADATATTGPDRPAVLLAWVSGGLPVGFSAGAADLPGVQSMTVARGGQADLVASARSDGTPVDTVDAGWAIPLDAIAVDPASFASFAPGPGGAAIEALRPGEALVTSSSNELRQLDVGSTLDLRETSLVVAGIISDDAGAGAEMLVHADDAAALGIDTERYLLIGHRPEDRPVLHEALAELAHPEPVRFRTPAETTWMRHGDAVVPQVFVKRHLGEFAYRDLEGRAVEIDPSWVEENIVTASVPILGEITCHRAMIEPLTAALDELSALNLHHLVDPDAYAGCWVPRRINDGLPLSRHTWGIAVDINIGTNPRGSFSSQDPRLVDLMRSAGFTWGGTWLVPDPGHYELEPATAPAP